MNTPTNTTSPSGARTRTIEGGIMKTFRGGVLIDIRPYNAPKPSTPAKAEVQDSPTRPTTRSQTFVERLPGVRTRGQVAAEKK